MTEPLVPFGRPTAAGGPAPGANEPLARLVENIARLIDRLHPPGSAAMPPGLSGATARLRRSLTDNAVDAASLAILSLKEILHEVESLRERTAYLDAASGKAFAELNTTEHRLRELSGQINHLWLVLAHAPHVSDAVRGVATDTLSDSDSRIQALRAALTAAPVASDSALADQVRTLREKAAALRKDHGRASDEDLRQRHEVEMSELRRRHDDALAAQRTEADQNRAELAEQLAQTRRALAILEAESTQLRATGSASQTRLAALEERLEETGTAVTVRQQAQDATQASLRSELASARLRISALETELAATESELAEREAELSEREADADSIAALHTRVSDLEADNRTAETDRDAALAAAERARSERDRCASDLVAAQAQIEDIEREMAQSSSARHRAIRDSEVLREQLAVANQQADLTAQADQRLTALAADRARDQVAVATLQQDLATAQEHHDRAQAQLAALTTVHEAQRETIEQSLRNLDRLAFAAESIKPATLSAKTVAKKRAALLEAARDWSDPDAAHISAQALVSANTELTTALQQWLQQVRDELDMSETDAADLLAAQTEHHRVRTALTTAEQQLRQAQAQAQAHVETVTAAQAEQSRQAIRLEALDEELRTAQSELAHARAAAEAAVETAQAGERGRREGDQQRLAQSEASRAQAHEAAHAATSRADALQQRLHAVIAQVAATVDLDERSDDAVVEEALAQLHAHLEEIESAAASTRSQLRAAEQARAALHAELTELHTAQAAQAEQLSQLETTLRSSEQQRSQLQSERDTERASAEARQRELIAARSELAATGADLESLHTTINELEERLIAAKTAHDESHALGEAIASADAATRASEERLGALLSAIKMLGHAANEATDRVGVGLPAHSRNLTRTTARIERAEHSADPTVAVANARTVCERAAEQCEALATALANERQARRTTLDERDQARAESTRLHNDVAGWEQQLSALAEAQQAIVVAQAEQQQLHTALSAAEASAQEQTATSQSELRQQRASVDELSARLAASQDEARELHDTLRRATQEHARQLQDVQDRGEELAGELSAAVAEAQGRAESLTAAIDTRDEELAKARQAVDRLRAGAADNAQQQARVRSLNTQLAEATAALDQLRSERDEDRERLRSVADLEVRVRELTQAQHAALATVRSAEAALSDQRSLLTDAEQRADRLQRTLDRQRAALSSALHDDPPTASISRSSAPSASAPDSPAL